VVGAFRQLHPDWGAWIAGRVSSTDAKQKFSDAAAAGRARYIREWALGRLEADPSLDLVIAGHSHLPVVEAVSPGRYYANSGDWIHHRTYLALNPDGGAPQLLSWGG
jgi:UDP-2,3-diacylglucosamine hydrolase